MMLSGKMIYSSSQKDVVKVNMAKVSHQQLVEKVPAQGKVVATDKEVLLSEANGTIKTVYVDLGDKVQAGQVLADIYVPKAQEKLAEAEAALSKAHADLYGAQSGGKSSELVAAEVALRQTESDWKMNDDTLKRDEELYAQGAITRVELDKAKSDFETSDLNYEKAQAEHQRMLTSEQNKLQYLKSTAESARLKYESARLQASGQGLVSPREGNVLSISVVPGEVVNENSPILTISSLAKLEIQADVPETEANKIRVGQKVQITGTGFSDTVYQGKVAHVGMELIAKGSQSSENYLPIVVDVDEPGGMLPGYSVDLDIITAEGDALVIPVEALVKKDEGNSVWLIKDSSVKLVRIQTGISDGITIQVKAGLELDNQVVANPGPDIAEGKKVRAK